MGLPPTTDRRSSHRIEMDTTVENPDFVREFTADAKGRITLGKEYADKRVKAAVGVLSDKQEDETDNV